MTLTTEAMQAAHFARRVDLDPDLRAFAEHQRPRALARELGEDPEDYAARYREGKAVLEHYTLSVSFPYWKGTVPDSAYPTDAAGCILVDAGHIAGTEAVRVVIFRPRH